MSPTLDDCNYGAVLCFQVDPLRSSRMRLCMSGCSFTQHVFEYPSKWLQRCLVVTWLVERNCCHLGARSVYTMSTMHQFTVSLHSKLHAYGACEFSLSCPLHFWQKDRDLLRATAGVTRGWNGYRNKSQHRTLTLEKKIRPPLLPGFEPKHLNHKSGTVVLPLSCLRSTLIITTLFHPLDTQTENEKQTNK